MMVRTPSYDKNGLKKGTWTPEEDKKLVDYITRYGHWNWRLLPKFAGLARCGKSCRLRWLNYLRPNLKRGNYTEEEEDTIIKLHQHLGNRWSAIAARMPGRTDNEIKNHWHSNLKKRSQQDSSKDAHEISNTKDLSPTEPAEHATVTSTNENHFLKDEFAFWDADTDLVSGNLWSEPYVFDSHISYVTSEPDNFSSVFDAELWSHDN